jgi:N-acetylneuraminic acid mutarotase
MPNPRLGFGVTMLHDKIYVIGGSSNLNEFYDTATGGWILKTSMPTSRVHLAIVTVQYKIYAIGGYIRPSAPTATNEAYDPETDTWTTRPSMPTARAEICANVVKDKIYVTGGFETTAPNQVKLSNKTEVYDPTTNKWTIKADMPYATATHCSTVVGDKIYVLTSPIQIYDTQTNTWTVDSFPPEEQKNASAVTIINQQGNELIYIIGGGEEFDVKSLVQIYNPKTETWSTGLPMPTPRRGLAAVVVNNLIYALGGLTPENDPSTPENFIASPAYERYIPFENAQLFTPVIENSWKRKLEMPTARNLLGVAVVNEKIYAIGGQTNTPTDANEQYDPQTNNWTTKMPMPTARYNCAVAELNGKIYVIGGLVGYYGYVGTNEVYDPQTDTWETKASMPTLREGVYANVVSGKIYLIGGRRSYSLHPPFISDKYNLTEVYDPTSDSWTTKAPPPIHVAYYASAVFDDKIFIFSNNLTQIYDPKSDTWSYGKSANTSLIYAKAVVTSGLLAPKRIHVVRESSTQCIYDPVNDVWSFGALMMTYRSHFALGVVNDKLYALGGIHQNGWSSTRNEEYTPFSSYPEPTPTPTATPTPTPTITPTSTPEPSDTEFPIWIVASIIIIAVCSIAIFAYFKKTKK